MAERGVILLARCRRNRVDPEDQESSRDKISSAADCAIGAMISYDEVL